MLKMLQYLKKKQKIIIKFYVTKRNDNYENVKNYLTQTFCLIRSLSFSLSLYLSIYLSRHIISNKIKPMKNNQYFFQT